MEWGRERVREGNKETRIYNIQIRCAWLELKWEFEPKHSRAIQYRAHLPIIISNSKWEWYTRCFRQFIEFCLRVILTLFTAMQWYTDTPQSVFFNSIFFFRSLVRPFISIIVFLLIRFFSRMFFFLHFTLSSRIRFFFLLLRLILLIPFPCIEQTHSINFCGCRMCIPFFSGAMLCVCCDLCAKCVQKSWSTHITCNIQNTFTQLAKTSRLNVEKE